MTHPPVPLHSRAFEYNQRERRWKFRLPMAAFGSLEYLYTDVADADPATTFGWFDGVRPYVAAVAIYEWSGVTGAGQFKFETYGPFLDWLKERGLDVSTMDMWARQNHGDIFVAKVCEEWRRWGSKTKEEVGCENE